MIPRVIPTVVPQLVTLIPTYVFIEATLAVLGLGDPLLPTWGKIINDASENSATYTGLYYWVLEPSALLMITGLAFALLGFALDRIFNPRLREM
jgi:peptide/nickel transport system permease protein